MTDMKRTVEQDESNKVLAGCSAMTHEFTGDFSTSYSVGPSDSRCKYWAKVIRFGQSIPMPSAVSGANDIPGDYLRKGDDVELFAGDWLLEGEEVSHRKTRGWTYQISRVYPAGWVRADGEAASDSFVANVTFGSDTKDALRKLGGQKPLLMGSGDCAAMIREIHYRRLLKTL